MAWNQFLFDMGEALRFREKFVLPSGENMSLFGRQFGDVFLTSSHSCIAECAVPLELLLDLSTTMPNLRYIRPETHKTLVKCHSPISLRIIGLPEITLGCKSSVLKFSGLT